MAKMSERQTFSEGQKSASRDNARWYAEKVHVLKDTAAYQSALAALGRKHANDDEALALAIKTLDEGDDHRSHGSSLVAYHARELRRAGLTVSHDTDVDGNTRVRVAKGDTVHKRQRLASRTSSYGELYTDADGVKRYKVSYENTSPKKALFSPEHLIGKLNKVDPSQVRIIRKLPGLNFEYYIDPYIAPRKLNVKEVEHVTEENCHAMLHVKDYAFTHTVHCIASGEGHVLKSRKYRFNYRIVCVQDVVHVAKVYRAGNNAWYAKSMEEKMRQSKQSTSEKSEPLTTFEKAVKKAKQLWDISNPTLLTTSEAEVWLVLNDVQDYVGTIYNDPATSRVKALHRKGYKVSSYQQHVIDKHHEKEVIKKLEQLGSAERSALVEASKK